MDNQSLLECLERLRSRTQEGAIVEFKSNLNEPKEIGAYISALANSAALEGATRAWMVWGVVDGTHEVVGTSFNPFAAKVEGNQSLIMWLQQMTAPRADFTFHPVQHAVGSVVMLEIHPARTAPVAFQNMRYIRIDSHKTRLNEHPDKEARLWAMLGQKADWSGELVPDATLDDLAPEAIAMARKRLTALRFDKDTTSAVCRLIELHLRFFGYAEGAWTDSAVRRYVRDAGDLLPRLHKLVRADVTTRNAAKARRLRQAYDDIERRIDELAAQEELDAIRPDLDGTQIMAELGVSPGPVVGKAYAFLLEQRLDEGPLGESEARRRLRSWAQQNIPGWGDASAGQSDR